MGTAYPHAFSASLKQSFGCFVDGRLVSFIGLVPSIVKIGPATLAVYSIGSVCTELEHRGKGYAGLILQHIIAHGRRAKASLILISGHRGIYERAGSQLFGDIAKFPLDATGAQKLLAAADPTGRLRIRALDGADWFAVKQLADARHVRFEQSVWDIAGLIQASAMASNGKLRHQVWVAEDDDGVQAYAVLAVPGAVKPKGAPCAVEWGGRPTAVAAILAHGFAEAGVEQLNVSVASYDRELIALLSEVVGHSQHQKHTGSVLVLDTATLVAQLMPYWQSVDAAACARVKIEQEASSADVKVSWDHVDYVLTGAEWISLLFDSQSSSPVRDGATNIPYPSEEAWKAIFPVPFPSPAGLNYV